MYALPVNPKVVVFLVKDEYGKITDIKLATNIAPETKLILCESDAEFVEHSKGLPFSNAE